MSIEEAIKHCEEVAEKLEKRVKPYQCESINKKLYEVNKKEWDSCLECASEHRQLAKWLRELRAYRKAEKEIEQELVNWNDIDNGKCRGLFLATSIIQHYKDEEVNADDKK